MKIYFFAFILFASIRSTAQTSYLGTIDKYPIELLTDAEYDGPVKAVYAYIKFQTPIKLTGTLKAGILVLEEKDAKGNTTATFTFNDFKTTKQELTGIWKSLTKGTESPITLKQNFNFSAEHDASGVVAEVIQAAGLKDKYFRIVLTYDKEYTSTVVSAVKVFEKRTNKLLQEIPVEGEFLGVNDIEVDDYNFDGQPDFSVFDMQHAGANVTRSYFLFDPASGKFIPSHFEGVSLEFDQKKKLIYENNASADMKESTVYKVVNNKMVVVEHHLYKYNTKTGRFVEQVKKKGK
jgi:hypothetical protein